MNDDGTILAVCVSDHKGTPKRETSAAEIRPLHGILGDAHAGDGHRQLSALASESIDRMRCSIPDLVHGAFGENLVTREIDWRTLPVGSRLQLGGAVVAEVTQHGKKCHTRCAIYYTAGECIMPSEGVFLRPITPGRIEPGDPIRVLFRPETAADAARANG